MRVLVACEYSGTVRDAFTRNGHYAVSNDILPTESPGEHIQGDAIEAIKAFKPDLLIAHPPCTYLASSSIWQLKRPCRWAHIVKGMKFFYQLLNANVNMICVENPAPLKRLNLPQSTQYIHPWQFGEPFTKKTHLWLRGLPALMATTLHHGRISYVNFNDSSRGEERRKRRSKFFPGIASAMADQWG